ncbi:MAG: LysR family transcriptional regulator [Alicyclobacillus sp.]|nr:LysR family transcriptional regulator [Alicyclobacillus sp.]
MHTLFETLVALVEHHTTVRAAEVLKLTQPTVTRQVRQLEQELGVVLFDRSSNRLQLTRAGEVVYRYAKSAQALAERMREELRSLTQPDAGTVLLGAGLTPSIYLLPPALAAHRARFPNVQFQVRTGSSGQVLEMLLRREIDLGVVTTVPAHREEVAVQPLWRDDLWLVAPPDSQLARAGRVELAALAACPAVLMHRESGLRRLVEGLAERYGVHLQVAMETDSLESLSRLVQMGAGFTVLPRSCAQDDVASGRLAVVGLRDADLGARTVLLAKRRDSLLPACAERFAADLPGYLREGA